MDDQAKTKQQLIDELTELRQRVSEIEARYPVSNIDETNRAVEALRKSEERLELALKGADLGMWDYNVQTGEAFINERRAEMVGYSLEESTPTITWWGSQVHPEDLQRVRKAFNAHVKGRTPLYEVEHRLRHKVGYYIWVLARGKAVEWDKQGNPVRIVGTSLDITDRKRNEEALRQAHEELERRVQERTSELVSINRQLEQEIVQRKKAEEALRESEQKYRSLFDNAPVGIFQTSSKGQARYVNPYMAKLVGAESPEEAVTHFTRLSRQLYADPHRRDELIKLLREEGKVTDFEYEAVRLDGTRRCFTMSAQVSGHLSDSSFLIEGFTSDITERKQAEVALREREEKYRLLADNVSDFIWTTDVDLRVTYVSPSVERMYGWSAHEWLAFQPSDYLTQSSLELVMKVLGEELAIQGTPAVDPQRVTTLELEQYRKDGTKFWTEVSARFLYDDNGHTVGIIGTTRDINERRKNEDAIKSIVEGVSGEIGEKFFESSVVHFAKILDADFTLIGEILQRDHGAVVKTTAFCSGGELQTNFEYDLKGAPCEKVTNRGMCSYPRGVAELFPEDKALERRNIEAYVGVCLYDSLSRPIGIMAAMYLTPLENVEFAEAVLRIFASRAAAEIERKRSEESLKRLFTAVESAGETIVVTDSAGSIIYVNPAFEEITGYTRQEALGKNPRILKSGKHEKAFYREMWDTLLAGQVWRGRFTNRRKDGTLYEETATISPIKDDSGRTVNYVAVKRDFTGEAMLQKQLLHAQKMEAIGTLAGGMAHDFNNLLQAVLGYSDLLLMKKGPEDPDRKKLEVIQHAARDGADLVSRILTFSRKVESRTRPIDLNEEIRNAQKLLRRTVPLMIEIRLVLAENLRIIDADPAQVEQVLLNLAINAQHAMPDGGQLLIETSNVSISDEYLRAHLDAKPGKYVLLSVSDTGVGMEPQVLDRAFEPFFTTKANGEGTGLGLSMVHGIVSQHGGYIRCYSEPGRGTSFKIYFPVSATELISDLTLTREMPAFGTETILLVDDDDRVLDMVRQMIGMGGYQVLSARSGEEALEMYASHREDIALVILDLIMPGMGGKRCLQKLLRINPDAKILVASGYSSNGPAVDKEEGGARGFLNKPYDAKDILTAIRKVLDRGHL